MMLSVQIWNTRSHALHFQNADRENAKKLELGFSVNQLPYITDLNIYH